MHVEIRKDFLEVCLEDIDSEFDVRNMTSEELDEEVLVDEVCKANECFWLIAVY